MFLAGHEQAAQIAIALFADIAEPVPALAEATFKTTAVRCVPAN
jgi:hypothetical protein